MVFRPPGTQLFEFVAVSSLRAAQLMRGCTPRVAAGSERRATVTAQREVAAGAVRADARPAHMATRFAAVDLTRVQRSCDSGKDVPRP